MEAQASGSVQTRNVAFPKYASTIVPEIGCDIAKSRRAASGDPLGAGAGR